MGNVYLRGEIYYRLPIYDRHAHVTIPNRPRVLTKDLLSFEAPSNATMQTDMGEKKSP